MDPATLLVRSRQRAGLSQRELARRAGTSAAAVCLYEQGTRIPRVDTLARLVAAAPARRSPSMPSLPRTSTLAERGRDLVEVLALADALPQRHDPELTFPPFRTQVRR